MSNSSFSWVGQFKVKRTSKEINVLPKTDERYEIPKATYSDSSRVNSKRYTRFLNFLIKISFEHILYRFLGMYKYEEQTHGRIKGSLFRVAWKFCQTRIIIASVIRTLSIQLGVLGIALFFELVLQSTSNRREWVTERDALNAQVAVLQNFTIFFYIRG